MPTSRSYGDACSVARALDVVGERWALLIVRELLLGPQRFTDLRQALANASSNLISDRLRELQGYGVLRRRKLTPPASSWVYELTDWGRALEPIVLALGDWGVRAPLPTEPTVLSATSAMLFLQNASHPGPDVAPLTCRIDLDGRVWSIQVADGRLDVRPGEPGTADLEVRTDPKTFVALIDDPAGLQKALSAGDLAFTGQLAALRGLLEVVNIPERGSVQA